MAACPPGHTFYFFLSFERVPTSALSLAQTPGLEHISFLDLGLPGEPGGCVPVTQGFRGSGQGFLVVV